MTFFIRPLGYYGFIFAINTVFLIIGTFMDQNPAILILAPVFAPITAHLGRESIRWVIH